MKDPRLVWHKCHACDCEYSDYIEDGYWGYCPECRKAKEADQAKARAEKRK